MWLLPAMGWAWAHWERALPMTRPGALLGLLVAWALLHAGTLWLNAVRDRDRGEVLFGAPGLVPSGTAAWGMAALAGSVAVGAAVGPWPGALAAGCAALAVAYSAPRGAWKGHPVLGPLVNVLGYGLASPAAGFAVVGTPVTARAGVMAVVVMLGVLGSAFVAQAWQGDEDRSRGDRTLAARVGPAGTLQAARLAYGAAFALFAALCAVGWLPRPCLVSVAAAVWVDAGLRAAQRDVSHVGPSVAVETGRRLAWGALAVVGAAFAVYVSDSWAGGPVAGLATAGGHPAGSATTR